ncbi:MAG TPA: hypothetical protein VIQ54_00525 [Polyangia bacterium]|jgi:hypothetical protein
MNTGAWHTDSLRRRSAAALFGAGALSCVVDFASVGLRRLALLHNGEKLQLLAYLIVAVTIAVGIARGNGWAEGAGLLVAIAAAIKGLLLIAQVSEATEILAANGKPVVVPAYVLAVAAGRPLAFASSAILLLFGQPGRSRVIAGAVCGVFYLVLVVLDSVLPAPAALGATP